LPQSTLAVSFFFHLIATVVWIGGLVVMSLLVWPETQRVFGTDSNVYEFLARLRKRFLPLTHLSLAVLIVTGLVQTVGDSNYEGTLQFTNTWSRVILLKHVAVGGMFIVGLVLQFWLLPALERAQILAKHGKDDPAEWEQLHRNEVRLTWLNVLLGMIVLGLTAWATAL